MMDAAPHVPAQAWLNGNERSLGELTPEQSRKFVAKLQRLGAQAVHVFQRKTYPDGSENSQHLVVELPRAPAQRKSLLKELDRVAREYGYDGDPDDGQRYAYVKLG